MMMTDDDDEEEEDNHRNQCSDIANRAGGDGAGGSRDA